MPEALGVLNSFLPGVVTGMTDRASHDSSKKLGAALCVAQASRLAYIKLLSPLHTRWHLLHTGRAISLHGFMTDICFLHNLCEQEEVLTSSVTHRATKDFLPRASCSRPEQSCLSSGHRGRMEQEAASKA